MIRIEGVTGWEISQIDQSIAIAAEAAGRQAEDGVCIRARAVGPRYERWIQAVREDDEETVDGMVIHAVTRGSTYERAMAAMVDAIREIEATNPY